MNKNKNINIKPSKGISIVIKNDFQPEIKQKKKRKYKKKVNTDILKMPTVPSFIPQGDSFIKPQYNMSSLNRNVIFPGVPQSLPQLPPPPQLAQLMPPPTQQPTNTNFENMLSSFGNMIMNSLMPMESGFKSKSYIVELDDDIIDALPEAEKNKYIENKIKPQIEKEIKDITFPDEDKKAEFMNNAISIKTSKEYGTKHANKLIPFDPKYNGNEYYKANYISRLQEIINQDTIKTRGGITENTAERKTKAKDLLKAIGINIIIPQAAATQPQAAAAKPQPAAAPPPPPPPATTTKPPPAATKPPPPPPPPPTAAAAKPPPPPAPAAKTGNYIDELKDKIENDDDPEEKAKKKEATSKTQGTKDGKNLSAIKKQWINFVGYRDNYEKNLKSVIDDGSKTEEDKAKAKELLNILNEQYKLDAIEDMPNPTSAIDLKIVKPRFTSNEAYKNEYIKRAKNY